MPNSPELIITGALATKVSNIAPYYATAEAMREAGSTVHYVHGGIENGEGGLSVATPSQQEKQITQIVDAHPEQKFVILSQSMGALAALSSIEKYNYDNVRAISVAPPLLYPGDILRHPRITTRSKIVDGRLILPSYSFALGDSGPSTQPPEPLQLTVPPELFEEVDSVTPTYWDRTVTAIHEGGLRVVMPTEDWNQAALQSAEDLSEVTYLSGPHSLITDDAILRHNVTQITRLTRDMFEKDAS